VDNEKAATNGFRKTINNNKYLNFKKATVDTIKCTSRILKR